MLPKRGDELAELRLSFALSPGGRRRAGRARTEWPEQRSGTRINRLTLVLALLFFAFSGGLRLLDTGLLVVFCGFVCCLPQEKAKAAKAFVLNSQKSALLVLEVPFVARCARESTFPLPECFTRHTNIHFAFCCCGVWTLCALCARSSPLVLVFCGRPAARWSAGRLGSHTLTQLCWCAGWSTPLWLRAVSVYSQSHVAHTPTAALSLSLSHTHTHTHTRTDTDTRTQSSAPRTDGTHPHHTTHTHISHT